jgi:hypothetical protein
VHAGDPEAGRPRTAILVSGMHRSGTSAITRVVSLLGAGLPGELIEAKSDNERGFWEGRAVIDLDERVLERFGSWWGGWQSVDPRRLRRSKRFLERARKLVREEFPDTDLIVLKDPRVSRLLPLWQRALDEEGFRCVHVVALRHPGAVAGSLEVRNSLSPTASTLSWLAHNLDAEEHSRKQPHVFVSFENLLGDWRAEMDRVSRALDITWPEATDAVAETIDGFIEPDLAHKAPADDQPEAVSAVAPVYDVLQRWAADEHQPDDEATIDSWRRVFAPVRRPRSAVALASRERRKVIEGMRAEGRRLGHLSQPKMWSPIQHQAHNVEAEAAWEWLLREQHYASNGARGPRLSERVKRRG